MFYLMFNPVILRTKERQRVFLSLYAVVKRRELSRRRVVYVCKRTPSPQFIAHLFVVCRLKTTHTTNRSVGVNVDLACSFLFVLFYSAHRCAVVAGVYQVASVAAVTRSSKTFAISSVALACVVFHRAPFSGVI